MPFETERLTHVNPPTPEQLRDLANIGIRSAVARNKLLLSKGMHCFIDGIDLMSDTAEGEALPAQIRHSKAFRIGTRPGSNGEDKIWSMTLIDTFSAQVLNGVERGQRSEYRFEWSRRRTRMAALGIRLTGFGGMDEGSLEYNLEYFRVRDDAAAMLQVSEELRMVSADDCEELKRDMSEYVSVIETVSR